MALTVGDRLGPFEISAPLGAGAMGEVYRARDTRLGRDVAVKVLVPALAADRDAMDRLAHEARAVAAISHPNIVALYDVGQQGASAYVVTELLQGETLRARLARGPVPLRKAIDYGQQIAAALAAAHDRGIVHRDLKPDNIFLTSDGRIKVLDFGIAQMPAVLPHDAVTMGTADGATGAVLGSVGYIAPEQLRGAAVDHRADIFALGCILFELLTGRPPFAGASPADTIAAILNSDPPALSGTGDGGSVADLDRVVRRCLEKLPGERFQSARDLAFALDGTARRTGGSAEPRRRPTWAAFGLTAAVAVAAIFVAAVLWSGRRPPEPAVQPIRFGIPATLTWSDAATISPDGRYVVYTGAASTPVSASAGQATPVGRQTAFAQLTGRFWMRPIESLAATPLADTEAAVPIFFWSPDSRVLGYRAGTAIVVRHMPDGRPQVLAEFPTAPLGAAWGPRDHLIIATMEGIYRMPAAGGAPQLVMRSEPNRELWRASPAFLPDGERFLFGVLTNGSGEQALETRVATLDGRELGTVLKGVVGAAYVDGHLLYGVSGDLYAQRFDPVKLTPLGERTKLAQSVVQDWRTGRLAARASDTGLLVFRGAPQGDAQFTLVDRFGRVARQIAAPDSYTNFSLSPDEQRLIAARRDPLSGHLTLWLIDVTRGVTSLATNANDREDADDPTWAPDGRHIAYRRGSRLVMRLANGGEEQTVVSAEAYPDSFSPDSRFLVYGQPRGNAFEQWAIDIRTPRATPVPVMTGVTLADEGRFSPNGHWIAYHSNETGMAQVYVVPFPRTGEKWQLSQKGGVQPRWSADGNELFYLDPDGSLMSVRMPSSDPRQAAAPERLFAIGFVPSDALDQYAPLRRGFVIRAPVSVAADAAAVQVLVNWKAAVRR